MKVIENPLAKIQPVVLKKSEIVDRKKSPTSIMPKGLPDKLTREPSPVGLELAVALPRGRSSILSSGLRENF